MSKIVPAVRPEPPVVGMASPLTNGGMMSDMMRVAEYMATSKTIPAHLQKSPGDCLRVVEYSYRTGMSPYAIADSTALIGGKLAFEGKLVAAMINASPRIEGALDYSYSGEGRQRWVTVTGRLRGEAKDRSVAVSVEQGLRDSKGARSRWENDADQMLAYYGARVWARRHAPEVMLGIYTPDELSAGGRGEVHDLPSREPVDITPIEPRPEEDRPAFAHFVLDGKRFRLAESDLFEKLTAKATSEPETAAKVIEQNWAFFQADERKALLDSMLGAMDRGTAAKVETFILVQQEDAPESEAA